MKARMVSLGLVLVATLLFSFNPAQKSIFEVFKEINTEVLQNGMAYQTLGESTTRIGHRLTGSLGGKMSEEYAYALLKNYGYKAKYFPFVVESWARDTVSLTLVPENSDNFIDFKVVSLAHSPVSSHVTAKIVDCGDGLEDDFEAVKDQLQGKMALFNIQILDKKNVGKKNLHRSEKTALAIKYGAAGVISANGVEGQVLLTGTASVTGELIPIPAVNVSLESGKVIRKWIREESNIVAVLDMRNFSRPINARNIMAEHKGSSKKLKNEKIIVCGHLDSWDLAQGAIDNGIGSFSVMDIARVFKKLNLKTKRTVEFVLFMGEEQGLLGSKALVKKLKETGDLNEVKMVINLDMVNNINGFNAFGQAGMKESFTKIGEQIQKIAPEFSNQVTSSASLHSDHQPFMLEGIPVCEPVGNFSIKALNCYHANCDKFSLINKDHILNNVRYTAMMTYALANLDVLPEKVKSDTETRDYLIEQNLKTELTLGKEWRWGK
ncbi:MAG: M28 family peptidase [Leadbetterella sp.]